MQTKHLRCPFWGKGKRDTISLSLCSVCSDFLVAGLKVQNSENVT